MTAGLRERLIRKELRHNLMLFGQNVHSNHYKKETTLRNSMPI